MSENKNNKVKDPVLEELGLGDMDPDNFEVITHVIPGKDPLRLPIGCDPAKWKYIWAARDPQFRDASFDTLVEFVKRQGQGGGPVTPHNHPEVPKSEFQGNRVIWRDSELWAFNWQAVRICDEKCGTTHNSTIPEEMRMTVEAMISPRSEKIVKDGIEYGSTSAVENNLQVGASQKVTLKPK